MQRGECFPEILQLDLPIRCIHKNKGAGILGLVADRGASKSAPLFMNQAAVDSILSNGIGWKTL